MLAPQCAQCSVASLKTNHFRAIQLSVTLNSILSMCFMPSFPSSNKLHFRHFPWRANQLHSKLWPNMLRTKTKHNLVGMSSKEKKMLFFYSIFFLFFIAIKITVMTRGLPQLQLYFAPIWKRLLQFWVNGIDVHMWLSLRPQISVLSNCTWPAINYVL